MKKSSRLGRRYGHAKMSKAAKAVDRRIEHAYGVVGHGIQIDIMDIGKVFAVGRAAVARGASDAELEKEIGAFVQSIRKN